MGNISHLEKEMVKVIVVRTARPRVYTVSAGWWGNRRWQICHRILKFASNKCIQKVRVLLLCSSLPHSNLIITALWKTWDSQGLVGWRTKVASCSCSWLASNSSIAEPTIIYTGTDGDGGNFAETLSSHSSVCSSHPSGWLVLIMYLTPAVWFLLPEGKDTMNSVCSKLQGLEQCKIKPLESLCHISLSTTRLMHSCKETKAKNLGKAIFKHYSNEWSKFRWHSNFVLVL